MAFEILFGAGKQALMRVRWEGEPGKAFFFGLLCDMVTFHPGKKSPEKMCVKSVSQPQDGHLRSLEMELFYPL